MFVNRFYPLVGVCGPRTFRTHETSSVPGLDWTGLGNTVVPQDRIVAGIEWFY